MRLTALMLAAVLPLAACQKPTAEAPTQPAPATAATEAPAMPAHDENSYASPRKSSSSTWRWTWRWISARRR